MTRLVGGAWTAPEPPPFAKNGSTQSPEFSIDGRRLRFQERGASGTVAMVVERTADGWTTPRPVSAPFEGVGTITGSGRVYYSATLESKVWKTGIFAGRWSPTGPVDAAPLDAGVNIPGGIDYTPYVAPDESFLLFSSNRPTVGEREDMHIYVTFRSGRGTWSTPRRLFEIQGRFPSLSPDGKVLFFCGDDGNAYWVDAKAIAGAR